MPSVCVLPMWFVHTHLLAVCVVTVFVHLGHHSPVIITLLISSLSSLAIESHLKHVFICVCEVLI